MNKTFLHTISITALVLVGVVGSDCKGQDKPEIEQAWRLCSKSGGGGCGGFKDIKNSNENCEAKCLQLGCDEGRYCARRVLEPSRPPGSYPATPGQEPAKPGAGLSIDYPAKPGYDPSHP